MQTHQEVISKGVNDGISGSGGSFPSPVSYNLIFLTAGISFDYINFIRNCIKKKDSDDQTAIGWFTKTHVKDLFTLKR